MTPLGPYPGRRRGISTSEFYDAVNKLWLQRYGRPMQKSRVAIAVSGGVDSMALARLCKQLEQDGLANSTYQFNFQALIVNHKARKGSGQEAMLVRQELIRMGIPATILDLEWSPGVRPSDLSDFETQARRLRYRALGAACRVHNLCRLLLAHHADDQAETVLMRLASGQKGIGLRGMLGRADIPECWGKHGLSSSGYYETSDRLQQRRLDSGRGLLDQRLPSSPPIFEAGGIQIVRPLLCFRKQQLIDTCNAQGVKYWEDETNKDVRRTSRNAIRSLLSSPSLPMALKTDSLWKLSEQMDRGYRWDRQGALQMLECTDFLDFDIRAGRIKIRLPKLTAMEHLESFHHKTSESMSLKVSLLIQQLTELVTPQEDVPLHSLKFAVVAMFPEVMHPEDRKHNQRADSGKFTAAGVQFERCNSPLAKTETDADLGPSKDSKLKHDALDKYFIWSLSRQPFRDKSVNSMPHRPEDSSTTVLVQAGTPSSEGESFKDPLLSAWNLWDGRYWIRMRNHTSKPLEIRPFHKHDLQVLRKHLSRPKRNTLEEVLASAAPDKVRWTLPVIAHPGPPETNQGMIIALPTLGKAGVLNAEDEKGERIADWQIRYKKNTFMGRSREEMKKDRNMVISWEDS